MSNQDRKFLLRLQFDQDGYILLTGLPENEWRLSRKHRSQHTTLNGMGRHEAVEAFATALCELVTAELVSLDEAVKVVNRYPDTRPGFRPGYRQRELTTLANRRVVFLARVRSAVRDAAAYLVEEGWPLPGPRPLPAPEPPLVFGHLMVLGAAR